MYKTVVSTPVRHNRLMPMCVTAHVSKFPKTPPSLILCNKPLLCSDVCQIMSCASFCIMHILLYDTCTVCWRWVQTNQAPCQWSDLVCVSGQTLSRMVVKVCKLGQTLSNVVVEWHSKISAGLLTTIAVDRRTHKKHNDNSCVCGAPWSAADRLHGQ